MCFYTFLRLAGLSIGLIAFTNGASAAAASLNLAWDAEPRSIDPRYAVDANAQYLENLIHCSLVDFDADGRTVARLAKSWKWVSPRKLEVDIQDQVKFSDGTKVTAEDVKATYDFMLRDDLKSPSPRKGAFAKVKAIQAAGTKISFELQEPDSTFATNLVLGILPARFKDKEMLDETSGMVGCGPFKLKAKTSAALDLVRNEHYTIGAPAKLGSVTIKIVKDENTRYAKLQAGELDLVQNLIGRDKLSELAKKPHLEVQRKAGLNTAYLGFNMKDPFVGKPEVRRAIAHAIDREKIIKFVLNGLAVPATTLITPNDPFYNKSLPATGLDLAKAKQLLDQAGFKDPDGDGRKPRFTLSYKTTTDLTRVTIAKAIASDLKKIGINVLVETLEWGRFKADVEAGKVQMWSLAWVGFKDPDIYRFAFATESFPPNGGNRGWYSNAALDKLLAEARAETAFDKRAALYHEVQKIIANDMPYAFLWHEENFAVINKKVKGYELYADGRYAALQYATVH